MTNEEGIEQIESTSFDVRANLASGLGHFRRIVWREPAVEELLGRMSDPKVRKLVFERIKQLAAAEIDQRYSHPRDAALAVYAWLLTVTSPEEADEVATLVDATPNIWWARKILEVLDRGKESAAINSMLEIYVLESQWGHPMRLLFVLACGPGSGEFSLCPKILASDGSALTDNTPLKASFKEGPKSSFIGSVFTPIYFPAPGKYTFVLSHENGEQIYSGDFEVLITPTVPESPQPI